MKPLLLSCILLVDVFVEGVPLDKLLKNKRQLTLPPILLLSKLSASQKLTTELIFNVGHIESMRVRFKEEENFLSLLRKRGLIASAECP